MKKLLISVILLVLCLLAGGGWWLYSDMQAQLNRPLNVDAREVLSINPGTSLTAVSHEIVTRGWMSHAYSLITEGRRQGLAASIKAGEYAIDPGTTPLQLLHLIVSGKVIQYSLTIPEGWSFRQIMQAVADSEVLQQTLAHHTQEHVMPIISQDQHQADGLFFPDTYYFPAATTDVDFLQRAYDTMDTVLNEEWPRRASGLPYTTSYEALIMASIIEKETAVDEEREKIAGVFVRRLQRGMKLQTDPTVIFAMGEAFDGDIRKKDLSIDSPYNTYLYKGLPPTPIAAPGRASIRAALNPEDGNELYFVATGDGHHFFSATLAQHNQAVAKYQLNRQ